MTLRSAVDLHALGVESSDGASVAVETEGFRALDLRLIVSALDAATTLSVVVETAPSATGPWEELTELDSEDLPVAWVDISDIGSRRLKLAELDAWLRISWTITGGDATFSCAGSLQWVYATPHDMLELGVKADWLRHIPSPRVIRQLQRQSDAVDTVLRSVLRRDSVATEWRQPRLPAIEWDETITETVCSLAAAELLVTEGFKPSDENVEKGILDRSVQSTTYLQRIAARQRFPVYTERPEEVAA